jgi:hypothetical protein
MDVGIDLLKNAADCCNDIIADSVDRSDILSVDSDSDSDFLDITGIDNKVRRGFRWRKHRDEVGALFYLFYKQQNNHIN